MTLIPHILRIIPLAFAAALLLSSCEHADPLEPADLPPTLESIQANIFNTNCALSGCHTGGNPPMGLDLSEGNARANLVGVPSQEVPQVFRVKAGNADESYLVMKIEGAAGIVGQRMPLGREPLSQEQISLVREWIDGGAN